MKVFGHAPGMKPSSFILHASSLLANVFCGQQLRVTVLELAPISVARGWRRLALALSHRRCCAVVFGFLLLALITPRASASHLTVDRPTLTLADPLPISPLLYGPFADPRDLPLPPHILSPP